LFFSFILSYPLCLSLSLSVSLSVSLSLSLSLSVSFYNLKLFVLFIFCEALESRKVAAQVFKTLINQYLNENGIFLAFQNFPPFVDALRQGLSGRSRRRGRFLRGNNMIFPSKSVFKIILTAQNCERSAVSRFLPREASSMGYFYLCNRIVSQIVIIFSFVFALRMGKPSA